MVISLSNDHNVFFLKDEPAEPKGWINKHGINGLDTDD